MQTLITARHFELTPQMRDFVLTKVQKLERYSNYIMRAEVVLVREGILEEVEAKLHLRHEVLTAKAQAKDLHQATIDVVDHLVTQLKRHDDRIKDRKKAEPVRRIAQPEPEPEPD